MTFDTTLSPQKTVKSIQLSFDEILQILPQRPPFVMLDRVYKLKKGKYITASKTLKIEELLFMNQKKNEEPSKTQKLRVPEMVVAEAMGQAGIILFKCTADLLNQDVMIYLGGVNVRFFKYALVGDQLDIKVTPIKIMPYAAILYARTQVRKKVVAEGEMSFSLSKT